MIIRVCSPVGVKRVTVNETDSITCLYNKVQKEFDLNNFDLCSKQNGDGQFLKSGKHLKTLGLKHGDMIYLKPQRTKMNSEMEIDGDIINGNKESTSSRFSVEEDDIDKLLAKQDGRIYRQKNEQYCQHGPSGRCIHCVPLEPYDEEYLEHCNPPIKFMSFHAYLRKLNGGHHQGKFTTLDNINCKIKPGCKEHLPWPEGICTKCQPNTITLSIQKYRHTDNIMFENKELMDDFLDYWRKTGNQRVGIMFGYYTTFDQAPLGVKAVVSAIYEPAQNSTRKSVEILNLTSSTSPSFIPQSILELASDMGLRPVGWIFTDLVSSDIKNGAVKHYRGTIDTYFLTAQECITAAYLQNMFPNKSSQSFDGYFGSKFVTVVVTGDENNTIHFEGYQVSNQCMALVRDDILIPTHDAPELGYIRESTNSQYVPDVFCKQKDKYGNTVTKSGRPLPVEFLLVHMTVAFPKQEHFSLKYRIKMTPPITRFPIENRENIGEHQSLESLQKYLKKFSETDVVAALSNLHLLWFLGLNDTISLKEPLRILVSQLLTKFINEDLTVVMSNSENIKVWQNFKDCPEWKTLMEILSDQIHHSVPESIQKGLKINSSYSKNDNVDEADVKVWSCIHCTFHNTNSAVSCQMCGLPQ